MRARETVFKPPGAGGRAIMVQYMEWLKAFLFGIVEGITEWLPISSTGHMILLNEFVKLDVSDAFYKMFEVVIQLGAILAVVVLFWNQIWPLKRNHGRHGGASVTIDRDIIRLWCKIVVACIPAAVVGLKWNDLFEELFYNYQSVAVALIVYGIAFIVIETRRACMRETVDVLPGARPAGAHFAAPTVSEDDGGDFGSIVTLDDLSWKTALGIGLFQVLSLVPGTSRSGSTIIGGLLLGCTRAVASKFTFFLAIPVMFGASALKLVKFFLKGGTFGASEAAILGVGCVVAFVVSLVAIKWLMGFVKRHDFKVFGVYRIVLGIIVLAYFFVAVPMLGL